VLPITILPGAIGREVLSLCEMLLRLRAVGLTNGDAYELPITQNELADTLGMSGVHMNRVIMNLRAEKLIRLKTKKLTILDVEKLKAFGGFNPNYTINAVKQPSP
jgi:CRP-like cAMP-binding protein